MWIEFGEIKEQLMILLIYPIGIIFARYNNVFYQNNPYFYLFLFSISHFLALIPLFVYKLIEKIINKNNNKGDDKINCEKDNKHKKLVQQNLILKNEINELSTEIDSTKKREKYLKLSFISILYFSTYVFFYYTNYITTTSFYGNISMITEVIIKFIEFNDWNAWRDFIFPTILNFIVYFVFCFYLIKSKSYIEKYFISPYELIIFLGIFCLVLLFIFEPITFFIPCDNEVMCFEGHFAGIISGFKIIKSGRDILICCLWIIFLFMTCFGLWLTVVYLSPSHFLTSDSLITFGLNVLIDCVYNKFFILMNNPLFYIFSIITIFGCLIYNEIIIIKIYNLDYNTRNEIIKRQKKDFYNYDDNEDDDLPLEHNGETPELSNINIFDNNSSYLSSEENINPNE
jgi:hypothetical protein